MISTRKDRRGFTLVEILVVVLIIVILMGLLFPAIQAARENARTTQCINNQQELGKALLNYEMTKNHLPGVLSFVNPSDPTKSLRINWVISIFGELGRMDLWQAYSPGTGLAPVKVGQLICPSNNLTDPVGGLSYAVNLGVYQPDSSGNPDYSVRLFRNRASWNAAAVSPLPQTESDQTITSLKASNRTVMLSEHLTANDNSTPPKPLPMRWDYNPSTTLLPGDATTAALLSPLAFQWPPNIDSIKTSPNFGKPYTTTFYGDSPRINTILSSNHRGMINVTFFDGHTEKIPETTYTYLDPDNQLNGTP